MDDAINAAKLLVRNNSSNLDFSVEAKAGRRKTPVSSRPPSVEPGTQVTAELKVVPRTPSQPPPRFSSYPPPPTTASTDGPYRFGELVAISSAMRATYEVLARFAPSDVTVTLLGETGTGKDVLAREIHAQSSRTQGAFVVFDCGAVAPNLAESELLGHERGAFTGAVACHAGAFERAQGGTLFLDEIGELPLDLQPKLLRALESRKGRRVGGAEDRPFDVRIIAATNRDLRAEVAAGRFRRDLYFRLGSALVPVPALRERLQDLPLLVRQLLNDLGRSEVEVSEEGMQALRLRSWPGNVRELKNTLACALAFLEGPETVLDTRHLSTVFDAGMADDGEIERLPLGGQKLDRIERAAILQTLIQAGGNKVRAAQVLGIAVSTLYEKLKKYEQV